MKYLMNNVRNARKNLGLTQRQLSALSGVSRSEIASIESENRVPSVFVALLIAEALNGKVDDIYYIKELLK